MGLRGAFSLLARSFQWVWLRVYWPAASKRLAAGIMRACLLLLLALVPVTAAHADQKIALVIGNESYRSLELLPYASRNARQVAEALGKVGFVDAASDGAGVTPLQDATTESLVRALQDLRARLDAAGPGATAFVYFAGHGGAPSRRGDVYLLPVDAALRGATLDQAGLPLADVLALLRGRKDQTVIVVVDACRSVLGSGGGAVVAGQRSAAPGAGAGGVSDFSALRGQAAVGPGAPQAGYFVAFSTSPDVGAYDSDLFSRTLAAEISGGRDLLSMFKRVAERMALDSPAGRIQLPTYEVGLYGAPPCLGPCAAAEPGRFFDCAGCPWMRVAPSGSFLRGSPIDEPGRDADEPQALTERIERPYAIGAFEVTRSEWRACERAGACAQRTNRNTWMSDQAPVTGITAADAQAYLSWLSAESGHRYRLPTEKEWEHAARAGSTAAFSFGDAIAPSLAAYDYSASYKGSPRAEYRGAPESVGAFPPNGFGLSDLHGNVWEWTAACPDTSPDCNSYVLRGGSYKSAPGELRAANRLEERPTTRREDVGLRVLRDLAADDPNLSGGG